MATSGLLWMECRNRAGERREAFYAWRDRLGTTGRFVSALAAAVLIGLSAQVAIPLPFTPVPLTLQTFAVAASGVVLGRGWGGLAAAAYVALAALGMPWLAGGLGGWHATTGSTFGYMLGFAPLAMALGWYAAQPSRCRWLPTWGAFFLADMLLILLPGTLWLWGWLAWQGRPAPLAEAFALGFLPFLAADLFKSAMTSVVLAWLGRRRRPSPCSPAGEE